MIWPFCSILFSNIAKNIYLIVRNILNISKLLTNFLSLDCYFFCSGVAYFQKNESNKRNKTNKDMKGKYISFLKKTVA